MDTKRHTAIDQSHIIEITPELERRVLAERRRGPREKLMDLERACRDALAWFEHEPDTASLPIADILREALNTK